MDESNKIETGFSLPELHCLEIVAKLRFLKPIAGYSDIECEQIIAAFVSGDEAADEEIRRLEAFRRALLRLAGEALEHDPRYAASDVPHLHLTLRGGEECGEPLWVSRYFVSVDDECCLELVSERGWRRVFSRPDQALAALKMLVDAQTGFWASCVAFGARRAGS